MYIVTQYFYSGGFQSNDCEQEGEMLDRVRYATASDYVARVEVITVPRPLDENGEYVTDNQGACQAHKDVHVFNDECVGFHEVKEA